jgi:hypothetical protein
MSLNPRQTLMLRAFAHSPRNLQFFTNGNASGLSPHTAQMYADEMQDRGYIECDERGTYSATPLGLAYLDSHRETAPAHLIGNFSTPPGSYRASPLQSTRPGADDHKRFSSRGLG